MAPEGRKVGSLKQRVRSHLGRWELKNCTPLLREANLELKMHETLQLRSTFGSWAVEKVNAVVARSTFGSQNAQLPQCRSTFGSWDVEKVHAVVVRSTFRSQNVKSTNHTTFATLHYTTLDVELHRTTLHWQLNYNNSSNNNNNDDDYDNND